MSTRTKANLLLVLTALIWGVAFVAQDVAMDSLPPFTFNGARKLLAGLALLPVVHFFGRQTRKNGLEHPETGEGMKISEMSKKQRNTLLLGGIFCGVCLAVGSAFQQVGIAMDSGVGKAGFISSLYIVMVPLIGLLLRKKVTPQVWIAVVICALGLYLLCMKAGFVVAIGDLLLILGALGFAFHILTIDYYSKKTDCLKMSCIQFFVASFIHFSIAIFTEQPTWQGFVACIIPIAYAGLLSSAVGYTLQIIAQKNTDPTIASLILCLESVFAALAGWVFLNEIMSVKEYIGCVLMLGGIVLAQLPSRKQTLGYL